MAGKPKSQSDSPVSIGDIQVFCQYHELLAIDKLVPHPNNPNKHPASQIEILSRIIKGNGFRQPIVISKRSGFVVKGHCRLLTAQSLKMDRVPVQYQDYESEAREYADLVADNKVQEYSHLDDEVLKIAIEHANAEQLGYLLGIDEGEIQKIIDLNTDVQTGAEIGDFTPGERKTKDELDAIVAKYQIQPGQIWSLGGHRLACGSCTDLELLTKLFDGQKASLLATDPPYFVDYDGTNRPDRAQQKDWSKFYGTNWDEKSGIALLDEFLQMALTFCVPNVPVYMWHASARKMEVCEVFKRQDLVNHQFIYWVKDRPVFTHSWYLWESEDCIFGWPKGNKPRKCTKTKLSNVWKLEHEETSKLHPCSKPPELFRIPMYQHTNPGDICFEPFSGSGSQILAAEKIGRVVYATELEPAFAGLAIQRWEETTGKKATLIHEASPTHSRSHREDLQPH